MSTAPVRVPRSVVDEVVAHARAALPNEACGYLVGLEDRVTRFVPVVNAEPSPYFYRMDGTDQLRIEQELAESGEDVVAAYHSHTRSPAFPSRTDLDLAGPFDGTYAILSLGSDPPVLKAFTMGRGRIAPRPLVVEG